MSPIACIPRPAPHRKSQRRERRILAEKILKDGQAQAASTAAEAAAALAVSRAQLTQAN